jgi:hypothetical protein
MGELTHPHMFPQEGLCTKVANSKHVIKAIIQIIRLIHCVNLKHGFFKIILEGAESE